MKAAPGALLTPDRGETTASRGERSARATRVGLLGATGYTGAELARLLSGHPGAWLAAAASRQAAGEPLSRVHPSMPDAGLVLDEDPVDPGPWVDRGVEVVFSALPHGAFAARARGFLEAGLRVVDLSADFRLAGAEEYRRHYGIDHPDPELLPAATYGLTEWCGGELDASRLVANPGCYATAVLLALLPVVEAGWIAPGPIVVNAVSGISGAGRTASLTTHFVECGGSAAPYRIGTRHQHLGEIARAIGGRGGGAGPVIFNPHLVPMSRGILATLAVPLARPADPVEVRAIYLSRYEASPFVRVLTEDRLPETRHVRGSNRCDLALRVEAEGRLLLVFAAIDNLIKGAAGQAIQNFNRMTGVAETTGLPVEGWGIA